MAENNIKARISLEGASEIRAALNGLVQSAQGVADKLNSLSDGNGISAVTDQVEELRTALVGAQQDAGSFGARLGGGFSGVTAGIRDAVTGLRTVAGGFVDVGVRAGLALGGIVIASKAATDAMAKAAAASVSAIGSAADELGLTIEQFQSLKDAAAKSGTGGEDFASGIGGLRQLFDDATTGIGSFVDATGKAQKSFGDLGITVTSYTKNQNELSKSSNDSFRFFRDLGVSLRDANGEQREFGDVLRDVRDAFSVLPEAQQKALEKNKEYGESVRALSAFLKDSSANVDDYQAAFAASGRAVNETQREIADNLTNAQKALSKSIDDAQTEIASALTATRDQVGLLFAPGKTRTTEFFKEIVDGTRQFVVSYIDGTRAATVEFVSFAQASVKAFALDGAIGLVRGLGQALISLGGVIASVGPALGEAFRTVRDISNAGFSGIADALTSLTGVDISASFVRASAAILALTNGFGAFTAIGTPAVAILTSLVGLLVGLGPISVVAGLAVVAFWDEFKTAAVAAYDAVLGSSAKFREAIQQLRVGDFRGAFDTLKSAGKEAFDALTERSPALARQLTNVQNILSTLGTNIRAVFLTVRTALTAASTAINLVFGTQLTASTLAFYLGLAQIAGILQPLSNGLLALTNIMRVLGLQGILVAAVLFGLVRLFPTFEKFANDAGKALRELFSGDIIQGIADLKKAFGDLFTGIGDSGALAMAALGTAIVFGLVKVLRLIAGTRALFTAAFGSAVGGAAASAEVAAAATAGGTIIGTALQAAVLGSFIVGLPALLATALIAATDKTVKDAQAAFKNSTADNQPDTTKNLKDDALAQITDLNDAVAKELGSGSRDFTLNIEAEIGDLTDLSDRARKALGGIVVPPVPAVDTKSASESLSKLAEQGGETLRAAAAAAKGALDKAVSSARDIATETAKSFAKPIEDGLAQAEILSGRFTESMRTAGSSVRSAGEFLTQLADKAKAGSIAFGELGGAARKASAEAAPEKASTTAQVTVRGPGGKISGITVPTQETLDGLRSVSDAAENTDKTLIRVFNGGKLKSPIADAAKAATVDAKSIADSADSLFNVLKDALANLLKGTDNDAEKAVQSAGAAIEKLSNDADALKTKFADLGTPALGGASTADPTAPFNTDALRPSTNVEDRRPDFGGSEFDSTVTKTQSALDTIQQITSAAVQQLSDSINSLSPVFDGVWNGLVDAATAAFSVISTNVDQFVSEISGKLQQLQDRLSAVSSAASGASSSDAQPSPFAGGGIPMPGGILRGPGTDTSDSLLIRASRDEGIVQAKAVRYYGTDLFHAFNQMRIPLDRLRGYAAGGIPLPSFALGGIADGLASNLAAAVSMPGFQPTTALAGALGAGGGGASLHPVTFNLPGGGKVSARMSPEEFEDAQRTFLVRKSMRAA